jgi:hypothetical protein
MQLGDGVGEAKLRVYEYLGSLLTLWQSADNGHLQLGTNLANNGCH